MARVATHSNLPVSSHHSCRIDALASRLCSEIPLMEFISSGFSLLRHSVLWRTLGAGFQSADGPLVLGLPALHVQIFRCGISVATFFVILSKCEYSPSLLVFCQGKLPDCLSFVRGHNNHAAPTSNSSYAISVSGGTVVLELENEKWQASFIFTCFSFVLVSYHVRPDGPTVASSN